MCDVASLFKDACKWKGYDLLQELEKLAKAFRVVVAASGNVSQNTRSGVTCVIIEEYEK